MGWALNLDGSAATAFALPRLEIEQSARGWLLRCRLGDGTSSETASRAGSIASAQRAAAELARGHVGDAWLPVVDALLATT
ncbi:MAG: hypothetical protein WCC48_17060 [Anaeromyxobacteraceae bacterium]